MDAVIDHACHDVSDVAEGAAEGAYPPSMPAPLPANGGRAAEMNLLIDMAMMTTLNGQERTYRQMACIAEAAGWKAKKVYQTDAGLAKITEFTKVSTKRLDDNGRKCWSSRL